VVDVVLVLLVDVVLLVVLLVEVDVLDVLLESGVVVDVVVGCSHGPAVSSNVGQSLAVITMCCWLLPSKSSENPPWNGTKGAPLTLYCPSL
jgi:hypothetical protein